MVKVSVITVCYNAVEDLKKTLRSVLGQTYTNYEYIVVDGSSTDGTQELLRAYEDVFKKRGRTFRYISEKDSGTYDAMNKGALMANGEYINYMNAGDCFYSEHTLEKFFSHHIDVDSDTLYGNTLQVFDFGSGIAKPSDYAKDNSVMPFCHQSCFVKAELVKSYKFDISYKIIADQDFFTDYLNITISHSILKKLYHVIMASMDFLQLIL